MNKKEQILEKLQKLEELIIKTEPNKDEVTDKMFLFSKHMVDNQKNMMNIDEERVTTRRSVSFQVSLQSQILPAQLTSAHRHVKTIHDIDIIDLAAVESTAKLDQVFTSSEFTPFRINSICIQTQLLCSILGPARHALIRVLPPTGRAAPRARPPTSPAPKFRHRREPAARAAPLTPQD